jgi:hypothetical protein
MRAGRGAQAPAKQVDDKSTERLVSIGFANANHGTLLD